MLRLILIALVLGLSLPVQAQDKAIMDLNYIMCVKTTVIALQNYDRCDDRAKSYILFVGDQLLKQELQSDPAIISNCGKEIEQLKALLYELSAK